jgi:hypothetical protein
MELELTIAPSTPNGKAATNYDFINAAYSRRANLWAAFAADAATEKEKTIHVNFPCATVMFCGGINAATSSRSRWRNNHGEPKRNVGLQAQPHADR